MSRIMFTTKVGLMSALGTAGGDLIENHNVSMATVGAVLCVVVPAAWLVAKRLTRLEDAVKAHAESIRRLPCQHPDCPSHKK